MLKSLVRINMVVFASALHKHACSEQWPQRAPNTLRLPAMSSSAKKPARNTEKTEKAIPSLFLLESLRRVSRCAVLPHCRARSPEVRCFLQRAHVFLPLVEARRVVAQHSGGRRLFLRDSCSLAAKMKLRICYSCNIIFFPIFDSSMMLFHGCPFCPILITQTTLGIHYLALRRFSLKIPKIAMPLP